MVDVEDLPTQMVLLLVSISGTHRVMECASSSPHAPHRASILNCLRLRQPTVPYHTMHISYDIMIRYAKRIKVSL